MIGARLLISPCLSRLSKGYLSRMSLVCLNGVGPDPISTTKSAPLTGNVFSIWERVIPSVFNDVSVEYLPEGLPSFVVERPLFVEAGDRAVGHVERVVGVVVRKQALAAERQQVSEACDGAVQPLEGLLVSSV